ncbi:hypothetical protein [Streptococcus oralis]|jgi:putative lipoprotein|uniref:Lipoprotein n=1 Tax=Streptococcus oralis subsp. tigurinus TaxID=1077464 RepID=A0A1X1G4Q3_STROR|nr:hypothetical protein [Streptococcus oralis]ORO41878.1 hypothetical protein B7727_08605 [Streptococcus oralis subsp. tigurinus]
MKKLFVIILLLILGGCSNGNKIEEKDTSKNETIIKEEKELKFVVAPQYEGKTSDLIELGKKLTKEHPELGSKGNMAIYFTGAVSDGRAALMLVNKTDVDIKKDLEFSLSWSYDGKTIFENQKISYTIKDSGELPSYTTTLILLPLNSEQLEIVDSMSDPSKMTLSMSDVKSVE